MTGTDLMERAAEAAHDAWWAAKKVQGFHAPEKCPEHVCGCDRSCTYCHSNMRPYADLSEATKELDRAHVRAVHGVYAAELERLRAENAALRIGVLSYVNTFADSEGPYQFLARDLRDGLLRAVPSLLATDAGKALLAEVEALREIERAARGVQSLAGERAHRVGCECNGSDAPGRPTCGQAWTGLRTALAALDAARGKETP